jgi:hypothetical protein
MSKIWIVESFDGESNSILEVFDNEKEAEKYKIYSEILDDGGYDSFYVTKYEVESNFEYNLSDIVFYYSVDFYDNEDSRIGKKYGEIIWVSAVKSRGEDKEYIEYDKEYDEFYAVVAVPYKENETDDGREEIAKEKGLKLLKEWSKNNENI